MQGQKSPKRGGPKSPKSPAAGARSPKSSGQGTKSPKSDGRDSHRSKSSGGSSSPTSSKEGSSDKPRRRGASPHHSEAGSLKAMSEAFKSGSIAGSTGGRTKSPQGSEQGSVSIPRGRSRELRPGERPGSRDSSSSGRLSSGRKSSKGSKKGKDRKKRRGSQSPTSSNTSARKSRGSSVFRLFSSKKSEEESDEEEEYIPVGEGIANKTDKGVPHVIRGTHGPARASETNVSMQSVWDLYDKDRDGWVTEAQLLDALEVCGIQVSEEELVELRREMEEELEMWSSEDDSAHSESDVSSDGGDHAFVYEDHKGQVTSVAKEPRGHERLWVREGGGEASLVSFPADRARLDRDRPEDFELFCAATGTSGLPLDETLAQIKTRSDFLRRIHFCQEAHETGGYDEDRKTFQIAWNDRNLDKSETQDRMRAWLRAMWAPVRWLRGGKKEVVEEDEEEKERRRLEEEEEEKRRKAAFLVQMRPAEERVKPYFISGLASLGEPERIALVTAVYNDVASKNEEKLLSDAQTSQALRRLGVFVNAAELFEMSRLAGGLRGSGKATGGGAGDEEGGEDGGGGGGEGGADVLRVEGGDDEEVAVSVMAFRAMIEDLLAAVMETSQQDKIVVEVLEGSDLPAVDRFGSADPYVIVQIYEPDEDGNHDALEDGVVEQKSTRVRQQNLNPEWNEELTLTQFTENSDLIIQVADFDPSGFGSDLIGLLNFTIEDLVTAPRINSTTSCIDEWFELREEDGSKIVGKMGSNSKLHCRVNYVRGELAAVDRTQRITGLYTQVLLTIVGAAHLPKLEKDQVRSPDPYVTVAFADQRFQTLTFKSSYEPVWEETFRIVVKDPVGEIVLGMYDWDPEGKDDQIGTCKVPLSLLKAGEEKEWFDLRTFEESTFVVGHDKERAQVQVRYRYLSAEDMAATMSPMEILFTALVADHVPTALEASAALWDQLHGEQSINVREGLNGMEHCWDQMASVLMYGTLEIEAVGAEDLPRMDYFGLCDPYLRINVDGYVAETDVVKVSLNPKWETKIVVPIFREPGPRTNLNILVECFDWDRRGDHDLVGIFEMKMDRWTFGGPDREWFELMGPEEKVPSLRAGEKDEMVRRPVIGHSGRPARVNLRMRYYHRPAASEECALDMAWSIALAVLEHPSNAEKFCGAHGGVSGLTAMLRKPLDKNGKGDSQQAACYALGNLTAAFPPAQMQFASYGGLEALLKLIPHPACPSVQRAACLCLANALQNNPKLILRTLAIGRGQRDVPDLVRRAGGIGTLIEMIATAKPDPEVLQKTGGDAAWDEVALATEAAVQALTGAAFVAQTGLFSDGKRTVEKVAKAVGRSGIVVLRKQARMPVVTKGGGKRATQDGVRFAKLCYESLESAYGLS